MKSLLISAGVVALIVAGIVTISRWSEKKSATAPLDSFAQCLATKDITMYGAAWCPHCQNEKAAFGDAFQFVKYVECPNNPQTCLDKGVEKYPTWIFSDGRKLAGELGLSGLARESGCVLPEGVK
ncbi:MAG: hypothetical protein HW383_111 [Candidatus Magasanikbacteria bacterium]|nr:hypothetical protein [Candidatus Magasanikbacteria bacterium]